MAAASPTHLLWNMNCYDTRLIRVFLLPCHYGCDYYLFCPIYNSLHRTSNLLCMYPLGTKRNVFLFKDSVPTAQQTGSIWVIEHNLCCIGQTLLFVSKTHTQHMLYRAENRSFFLRYIHHHHNHHKHQGLYPLIRSVSSVTTVLANVSSVFQLFFFLVVCSDMRYMQNT